MDTNTMAFIAFVLIVLIVLIFAGVECGIFEVIFNWFYDLFHPDPGPDLFFKPMEIRVRRCQECNSIITGLDIVIVRDDDHVQFSGALGGGLKEVELYEAIYCEHCGHQNIIGKYYRHASDDIQLKAQIARKDSKICEFTPNEMRKIMGLKPIQSEVEMSGAKKCDRCGALYVPYNFQNIGEAWRYSVVKCCHPYPDTTLDLCNNCLFALEKWIEKGGADNDKG